MKNYLVEFKCVIGDYEHTEHYIFNKKKANGDIAKNFGGINKRDSNCLKDNMFWDDWMQNAISVYSETEITNQEADVLQRLGVA